MTLGQYTAVWNNKSFVVRGYAFWGDGWLPCFVYKARYWRACEVSTGFAVGYGNTRAEAVADAHRRLRKHGRRYTRERIEEVSCFEERRAAEDS